MGIWYRDEANYANVAKAPVYIFEYIFDNAEKGSIRDYLINRGVMGTPFIKPGHIFFLAISFFIFGVHDYAPIFMMGIFGIALVYLVYRFGKEFLSNEVGVFSALIMAVSGHMIFYSRSAYPQMDTVFFGLLGFYYYLKYSKNSGKRKYLWYCGAAFAVGMLMHQSLAISILVLLLIDAIFIWRKERNLKSILKKTSPVWGLILITYLGVMAISKLFFIYFPQFIPRSAVYVTLGDRTIQRLSSVFSSYIFDTSEVFTVLKMILTFEGLLVFLLTFYGSFVLWRNRRKFGERLVLLILAQFWFAIIYWSFFSGGHPTGKAFMVVMPQLTLISAVGALNLIEWADSKRIAIAVGTTLSILIVSYGIYNVKPLLVQKSGYSAAAEKAVDYAKEKGLVIYRKQGDLTPFLSFYLGRIYDRGDAKIRSHLNLSSKKLGDVIFLDYRRYHKPDTSIEIVDAVEGYEPVISVDNDWVQLRSKFFTHYGKNARERNKMVLSRPDALKIWVYDISGERHENRDGN